MIQSDTTAFEKSGFFALYTAAFNETKDSSRPFRDVGTGFPTCA